MSRAPAEHSEHRTNTFSACSHFLSHPLSPPVPIYREQGRPGPVLETSIPVDRSPAITPVARTGRSYTAPLLTVQRSASRAIPERGFCFCLGTPCASGESTCPPPGLPRIYLAPKVPRPRKDVGDQDQPHAECQSVLIFFPTGPFLISCCRPSPDDAWGPSALFLRVETKLSSPEEDTSMAQPELAYGSTMPNGSWNPSRRYIPTDPRAP